ncbi:MAG TPA: hypothetical protein VMX18_00295 [Candidatus Bipolaricaulota bacterium]|nr:hypothetical protein [Candidatus Bipolaricaulota bacterium]
MKKKIFTVALAMMTMAVLAGCGAVYSTGEVLEAKMCVAADREGLLCTRDLASFYADTDVIYATAILANVPSGTKATGTWYYFDPEQGVTTIGSYILESEEINSDLAYSLSKPTNGWPAGNYQVEIAVDGYPDITVYKDFSIQ